MDEYKTLNERRRKRRIIYSSRFKPKTAITWKGWRCRDMPSVKLLPVVGTGRRMNHWVVYLWHDHEAKMIVSASFKESDAIDIAAATEAVMRGFASRGWQPQEYLGLPANQQMLELIKLVIEDECLEDDGTHGLDLFAHKGLLKVVKKIISQRLSHNI